MNIQNMIRSVILRSNRPFTRNIHTKKPAINSCRTLITESSGRSSIAVDEFFKNQVTIVGKDDPRIETALKGPLLDSVGPYHHAAFRTIEALYPIDKMVKKLESIGYEVMRRSPLKRLDTVELRHKDEFKIDGTGNPYIFLSSLSLNTLSKNGRNTVEEVLPYFTDDSLNLFNGTFHNAGDVRLPITYDQYESIKAEDQYAAWTLTNLFYHQLNLISREEPLTPFVLNHFAYDSTINHPSKSSFFDLASSIERAGIAINEDQGRFQEDYGDDDQEAYYFGQFSTKSSPFNVTFSDGKKAEIPTSYIEFTRISKSEDEAFKGFRQAFGLFSSTNSTIQKKKSMNN